MPLCKACGESPPHHHCRPFCPTCDRPMQSHHGERKEGNQTHFFTYYTCPEHGRLAPVMKDLCPICGAEIEVEEKVDEFRVDLHGPSGRLAIPFMCTYYMQGLCELGGDELVNVTIVPMDTSELRGVFNALVDKEVFTIERELKVVKIDPDALEQANPHGFVELRFVEMLREIKEHGFFKDNLHIAVEVKEE